MRAGLHPPYNLAIKSMQQRRFRYRSRNGTKFEVASPLLL